MKTMAHAELNKHVSYEQLSNWRPIKPGQCSLCGATTADSKALTKAQEALQAAEAKIAAMEVKYQAIGVWGRLRGVWHHLYGER